VKRAQGDHEQRVDEIDRYRANVGRDEYNAKRRKVRGQANADLSGMTPEQKAQYKKDQRSDLNWFQRQRDNGMAEAVITAAYAERLQKRDAERAQKGLADTEESAMKSLPHFGRF